MGLCQRQEAATQAGPHQGLPTQAIKYPTRPITARPWTTRWCAPSWTVDFRHRVGGIDRLVALPIWWFNDSVASALFVVENFRPICPPLGAGRKPSGSSVTPFGKPTRARPSCSTERLAEVRAVSSVGSRRDSYDASTAESVIGLYKTELIRSKGPQGEFGGACSENRTHGSTK